MQTVMFVLGQVVGVAAFLLGVFLLAGLGWALLVGGALLVAGATALEAAAGPSDRRRRANGEGAR